MYVFIDIYILSQSLHDIIDHLSTLFITLPLAVHESLGDGYRVDQAGGVDPHSTVQTNS